VVKVLKNDFINKIEFFPDIEDIQCLLEFNDIQEDKFNEHEIKKVFNSFQELAEKISNDYRNFNDVEEIEVFKDQLEYIENKYDYLLEQIIYDNLDYMINQIESEELEDADAYNDNWNEEIYEDRDLMEKIDSMFDMLKE